MHEKNCFLGRSPDPQTGGGDRPVLSQGGSVKVEVQLAGVPPPPLLLAVGSTAQEAVAEGQDAQAGGGEAGPGSGCFIY